VGGERENVYFRCVCQREGEREIKVIETYVEKESMCLSMSEYKKEGGEIERKKEIERGR
jgi:hypothetical protein